MILNSPYISGSLTVTGNIISSGSITISGSIASASYASNAERVDGLDSTSFVFTSSYNTDSASVSTRVTKIEGNYATTGSNIFTGAQTVCANITSTGTIIAQTLNVQQVTSSVVYSSGSNVFGCSLSNTQQFTGSVTMTGSLGVVGVSCFSNVVCALTFNSVNLAVSGGASNVLLSSNNNEVLRIQGFCQPGMFITFNSGSTVIGDIGNSSQTFSSGDANGFGINARGSRVLQLGTNQTFRMTVASTGETTFACQVCVPNLYASSDSRICGNLQVAAGSSTAIALYNAGSIRACISMTGNEGDLSLYSSAAAKNVYLSAYYDSYINAGGFGIGTSTVGASIILDVNGGDTKIVSFKRANKSLFVNPNYAASCTHSNIGADTGMALSFSTNNDNERLRLFSAGEACFRCQVCAPQYITTQGSSVSYAAGTNYIVWSSEGEICSQDNNTGGTYTTMKTWIADRTGCLTLRFAGYIQSGPNYWAWRVVRNGTTSLVCADYISCLAPGCSTSVHAYTTFQSNIGPVNPGDCITLQMVSSTGGGTPVNGAGQYLFAKELRLHSTTPNFSAGIASNVFGDRLGVGTCTPGDILHIERAAVGGTCMIIRNSCGASSLTNNYSILSLQLVGSGQTGQIGTNLIAGKELDYSSSANRDAFFAIQVAQNDTLVERMRITSGGIACFAGNVCAPYFVSPNFYNATSLFNITHCSGPVALLDSGNEAAANGSAIAIRTRRGFPYDSQCVRMSFGGAADVSWICVASACLVVNGTAVGGTPSDMRVKTNIQELPYGLSTVMNLKPVKYQYKIGVNGEEVCDYHIGFIANCVKEVFPETVIEVDQKWGGENFTDFAILDPNGIKWSSLLVKAIQELKCQNDIFKTCLGIA